MRSTTKGQKSRVVFFIASRATQLSVTATLFTLFLTPNTSVHTSGVSSIAGVDEQMKIRDEKKHRRKKKINK